MRHLVPLMAVLFMTMACSQQPSGDLPERPPPPRPLSGGKPYVCFLLPERAIIQATGQTRFTLADEDALGPDLGGCRVETPRGPHVVAMQWSSSESSWKQLENRKGSQPEPGQRPLPDDLGDGFTAYRTSFNPSPWVGVLVFECGKREPYISIHLAPSAAGRDSRRDLTDLLRFARDRYGQLNKCTPKPP